MLLPGRLKATTLGDLLGVLHRAQATGTLELVEDRGRAHRIHMASGQVVSVEVDGATAPLGVAGLALRRQVLGRLAMLEQLPDARLAFRVAVRSPRGALHDRPLEPREFLHGRRRARERGSPAPKASPTGAWRVLGVRPGADPVEIKRAYHRLARTVHPDLHPGASAEERRELEARFVEITEAYGALVAARLSGSA